MDHLLLTAACLLLLSPRGGFSRDETRQPQLLLSTDSIPKNNISFPDYINLLDAALNYQYRADSLMNLAELYRAGFPGSPSSRRTEIKTKISETERLADHNRRLAKDIMDSGFQKQKDTTSRKNVNQKIISDDRKPSEIYSMFEIVTKPGMVLPEKIEINPEMPVGLIYRIQVAAFRNIAAPSYFKGIIPVYGFKSEGVDVTTYYAGMFRKISDATKALSKVKNAGFKDAFIVALFDRKNVSVEKAGVLEKEWGNKPLATIKVAGTEKDTIPPTLIFRVEVIRSQKPLKSEQLETIKKLAGTRGQNTIKSATGQIIYLIGKFLTFEDAAEYTDLLKRNGLKDAKVVAYLGSREIPVETAKQLFEKY